MKRSNGPPVAAWMKCRAKWSSKLALYADIQVARLKSPNEDIQSLFCVSVKQRLPVCLVSAQSEIERRLQTSGRHGSYSVVVVTMFLRGVELLIACKREWCASWNSTAASSIAGSSSNDSLPM